MSISTQVRERLAPVAIKVAAHRRTASAISRMRQLCRIQLFGDELQSIAREIERHPHCRMMVFGLGNDSAFWSHLNRDGKTVFLEDNPAWFQKVTGLFPELEAYPIAYQTRMAQWQELLQNPAALHLELPPEVADQSWNVIFVDGPAGYGPESPGRMQSIFMASKLGSADADVFVHDCNREVEAAYCDEFLRDYDLVSTLGTLRHYRKKPQ